MFHISVGYLVIVILNRRIARELDLMTATIVTGITYFAVLRIAYFLRERALTGLISYNCMRPRTRLVQLLASPRPALRSLDPSGWGTAHC